MKHRIEQGALMYTMKYSMPFPQTRPLFPRPLPASNTDRPLHPHNHMSTSAKLLCFQKVDVYKHTRGFRRIAIGEILKPTAAFKGFSMAWLAFVYIFIRVIFCPMSFNISFKIFALDKIHAVIMCHFFCKIWLKKPERNSFMTKVSANHCALIDSFSGMLWFNF